MQPERLVSGETGVYMYKTIGIIGGMGPAATADLMMKITEMTDAASDQEHIRIMIDSNINIPDRTAAILHGGPDPVPAMSESAGILEKAGADFLIIPCNTAHYFIPELKKVTKLPILNMPAETAKLLKERGVKKAAVLATDGTVQSGLYQKALDAEGIEAIYPDAEQQKQIMSLIYDFVKKGIVDRDSLPVSGISAIADDLRARGAEALLLACTELPLGFDLMGLTDESCVDPTKVLACAAVKYAGAKVKQN